MEAELKFMAFLAGCQGPGNPVVFMFHRKWVLSAVLYRKKKEMQGFGEESREPSTGKHVFLSSPLAQSDSGMPVLS